MDKSKSEDFSNRVAGAVSVIFHPFLIPVYGLTIIFVAPTLFNYLPFGFKKLIILVVLVNNVMLPLSLMPILVNRKLISSWFMDERKDRVIPLIISTILYIVSTYIMFRFPVPLFMKSFFIAVSFLSLTATLVNFWWKISLHSIGAGLLVALVIILTFRMFTPLLWYLIPAILIAGLILSARLKLNFNSPGQVWVGFITGFAGFAVIVLLFQ